MPRRWLLPVWTLVACAWLIEGPVDPAVAQSGATVSADSILATARALSGETALGPPNRTGRWPVTAVYATYLRDRLAALLEPLGGTATLEAFDPAFDDSPPDPVRFPYTNVVGRLPGAVSGLPGRFVLSAHFDATSGNEALSDTTWDPRTAPAPGADDNASGVAAILEAVRVMAARGLRPQADLEILFFDGEEQQVLWDPDAGAYRPRSRWSLLGSTHRADSLAAAGASIHGLVNADMLAYNPRGDSLVVITNPSSRWLADHLLSVAGNPAYMTGDLLLTRLVLGLNFSDHGPFWLAGYDAVLLIESADIERHAVGHYHLATDTVDRTYSRGGSQVVRAAELLAGLLEEWSWTASDSTPNLRITPEDILVRRTGPVDLPLVQVGDPLEIEIGVTNRGGTEAGTFTVSASLEDTDGHLLYGLGLPGDGTVEGPLPAGARVKVKFPWSPGPSERGAVRIRATVDDPRGGRREATRVIAVEGVPRELSHLFVYPNPTRDPVTAAIHYELSGRGSVRLTLIDLSGRILGERDLPYSRLDPAEGTRVGVGTVPLADLLEGRTLAPGLYLLRAELFDPEGTSRTVDVARFAVIR